MTHDTAPRPRPARQRILAAADELFYSRGVLSTGIDAVTDHADVARKSLYNNFASKDDLVHTWLEQRHRDWRGYYDARVAAAQGEGTADGFGLVLAVFDAYLDHAMAAGEGFRGCGLLNTAAGYPPDSAVRQLVRRQKQEVEDLLALGSPTHADMLSHLLEGAVTRAGLEGSPDRLHRAREQAAVILGARTVPEGGQG
ncbi:TetR/AcrR family transcriptional regulator [Corynebacterium kalidii]